MLLDRIPLLLGIQLLRIGEEAMEHDGLSLVAQRDM